MIAAPVLSLKEEGTARLVFDKYYSGFEGVLLNLNDEVFALRGIPNNFSTAMLCDIDDSEETQFELDETISPSTTSKKKDAVSVFDMYIVDEETGSNYLVKKVKFSRKGDDNGPPTSVKLTSDSLNFESAEVLMGNRADKEFRQYMNPSFVNKDFRVYKGYMKINFHTSITPPSTPVAIPNGGRRSSSLRNSFARSATLELEFEPGTPREGDFFQ